MMTKLMISLAALVLLLTVTASGQSILPAVGAAFAQEATQTEQADSTSSTPNLMRVLSEEMTLVWLQSETYAHAITACLGNGLNNIQPLASGPMVIIPNAGDLSVDGSNVAIKLNPDGEITFIPRTQEQRIRVPVDVGDKVAGQEVLSLSLAEAEQLMASGHLIWTAQNQGRFGNGHGLPGHIAACDPLYTDLDDNNNNNDADDTDDNDNDNDNDD
jgi:hypothetical protein